jgi:hypothetical protein
MSIRSATETVSSLLYSIFLCRREYYRYQLYCSRTKNKCLSKQQAKAKRDAGGLQSLFSPSNLHRVSPRCDVTERWRLCRFTVPVREKSPCTLLPPPPHYYSSLISPSIPSLSQPKTPCSSSRPRNSWRLIIGYLTAGDRWY